MDTASSFFKPTQKMNNNSFSTNFQTQVFSNTMNVEGRITLAKNENIAPSSQLSLRKQLIELREDKTNYDVLYARLNGLKHKKNIMEEDRSKMKQQFDSRQTMSSKELGLLQNQFLELKTKTDDKEKDVRNIQETNEKIITQLTCCEELIKQNTASKIDLEEKLSNEKMTFEKLTREKSELEENQKNLERKIELTEEEIKEVENQLKSFNRQDKELGSEITGMMFEIRKLESQKVVLENTQNKQNELYKSKMCEKDILQENLNSCEKHLAELENMLKFENNQIKNLQKEFANCEKILVETETKLCEFEKKRKNILKSKKEREVEVIEQCGRLRRADIDLENKDNEIRERTNSFDKLMQFNQKLLHQLNKFEEENQKIARSIGNSEELKVSIEKFGEVIANSKEFLASI